MGLGPNKFSSLEDMADAAEASEMPPSAPEIKPTEEACDGACCGCDCKKDGE
jgi:hypothetical protein